PVAFVRADGHAVWVNSKVLEQIDPKDLNRFGPDSKGGRVLRDGNGEPTGVLLDHAMSIVLEMIPKPSGAAIADWLRAAAHVFNHQGFTHIRDLTCNPEQWQEARKLEDRNELTLAVEQYFDADPFSNFDRALDAAKKARADKSRLLRVKGIKVYYDGALGSEGALISHPYRSGATGLRLMTPEQFTEAATRAWNEKFDLAIHVIGDQAADEVARKAVELWDRGATGTLHLEHAELLRPETIQILKGRPVRCHIQPCHWLTDHHWLHEKIGDLAKHAFPWAKLQENGIEFDFGSDSPIETPSLESTIRGVAHSASSGIEKLRGDPLDFHQHPDREWTPNTQTEIQNGRVSKVEFLGHSLIY
ncbi:MAG: amidohydrolase family protein, partial [Bdellovibrionia bacterium]